MDLLLLVVMLLCAVVILLNYYVGYIKPDGNLAKKYGKQLNKATTVATLFILLLGIASLVFK